MTKDDSLRARLAALPRPEPPPRIGVRLWARIATEETAWRRETIWEQFADGRRTKRILETYAWEDAPTQSPYPAQSVVCRETQNGMTITQTTYW